MAFQILRKNDQVIILADGEVADGYFSRLVGLIGKRKLAEGQGLLFPKCNSIHMWMMSMPIDVLFLKVNSSEEKVAREWTVVSLHRALQPWRILPVTCMSANDVLELPVGTIDRLKLKMGEVLCTVS